MSVWFLLATQPRLPTADAVTDKPGHLSLLCQQAVATTWPNLQITGPMLCAKSWQLFLTVKIFFLFVCALAASLLHPTIPIWNQQEGPEQARQFGQLQAFSLGDLEGG